MKDLILGVVVRFIKRNMHHGVSNRRNAIFKAINDGMAQTFNEDNIHNRIFSTTQYLLENDTEAQRYKSRTTFVTMLSENARVGVIKGLKD